MNVMEIAALSAGIGVGLLSVRTVLSSILPHLWQGIGFVQDVALQLFVKKYQVHQGILDTLIKFLVKNDVKCLSLQRNGVFTDKRYVKSLKTRKTIFFRNASASDSIFFYGGFPFLVICNGEDDEGCLLYSFRGSQKALTDIFVKAAELEDEYYDEHVQARRQSNYYVKTFHGNGTSKTVDPGGKLRTRYSSDDETMLPFGWDPRDITKELPDPKDGKSPLDSVAKNEAMDAIIKDIEFWNENEKWYRDKGISWRRGYLLFGSPGNGKTSLVRAIGQEYGIPIHIFDLTSMSNEDLGEAWAESSNTRKRIVLLEDIDGVYEGREGVRTDVGFDFLLNLIDGVQKDDGTLLFITTNEVEKVDEALGRPLDGVNMSSRPGRVDKAAEVPRPNAEGLRLIGRKILDEEEDIDTLLKIGHQDSGAQFQERCVQFALQKLWDSRRPT